jgi:hypothetical protein
MTLVERNPIIVGFALLSWLLGIFIVAFMIASTPTTIQAQAVVPTKWDDRMIDLDKQALDQAYVAQMAHVFGIWIKDGVGDPARARVGFSNARKGYTAAMNEVERRSEEIKQRGR